MATTKLAHSAPTPPNFQFETLSSRPLRRCVRPSFDFLGMQHVIAMGEDFFLTQRRNVKSKKLWAVTQRGDDDY